MTRFLPSRPLGALLALSLFGALLATPAVADDGPVVEVNGDGTIDGRVVVGAPPDKVDSYLSDIATLRRHSKDVVDVQITREGGCELVTTTARNVIEMSYTSRRCRTKLGWVETLLESDGMSDYYAEWMVTPVTGGIEVRFRLRTELDLPVPSRMLRGAMKRNVRHSLELMQETLGGPDEPPRQLAGE